MEKPASPHLIAAKAAVIRKYRLNAVLAVTLAALLLPCGAPAQEPTGGPAPDGSADSARQSAPLAEPDTDAASSQPQPLEHRGVDALYRVAHRLARTDAAAAERIYRQILREAPYHYRTRLALGRLLLHDRPSEAVVHLGVARRVYPNAPEVHYLLGQALEALDRPLDAAEAYREAIRLDPRQYDANTRLRGILRRLRAQRSVVQRAAKSFYDNPNVATLTLFGRVVMRHAEPRQAVLQFEEVLRREPGLPEAHLWLARARHAAGDTDGEIAAYRDYLASHAEATGVRLMVVRRMLEAGFFRQAGDELAPLNLDDPRAAQLSPAQEGLATYLRSRIASARDKPALAGELLAQAAKQGQSADEVRAAFHEDLALYPDNAGLWFTYASWLRQDGDSAGAAHAYRRSGELDTEHRRKARATLRLMVQRDEAPAASELALGALALADGDENGALRHLEAIPPGDPLDSEASLLRGQVLRRQGSVARAVDAFLRYVLFQDTPEGMRFARGHVLWVLGREQEALTLWNEQPEVLEAHPDVLRDVAEYYRRENDPIRESKVREQLARVQPANQANRIRLGDLLLARGYRREALEVWEAVLQLRPRDPELLERIGRSYLVLGQSAQAVPYLRRAAQLKPLADDLNEVLARALYERGEYGDALHAWWQVYLHNPDHPDLPRILPELARNVPADPQVRRAAVDLALKAGNLTAAADLLESLVADAPENAAERAQLADVYLRLDRPDAAERVILGPDGTAAGADAERLELLAQIQTRNGRTAALADTLQRLQALRPDDATLQRRRALLLAGLNRDEEALPLLEAVVAASPDDLEARMALAGSDRALGRLDAAAEQLGAVLQRKPDQDAALRRLIDLRLKQRRYVESIPLLERWVDRHPRDDQARYNLVSAYLKRFRKEAALPHYEALRTLNPRLAARLERYFQ